MAAPVGFGRYQLDRLLALGGMGEVFLARQTGPGGFERQCVVKRLLLSMSAESEYVELFLHEARLTAHLTHPNLAQVYDFGQVDDLYYIAMEYVPGPSLRTIVRGLAKQNQRVPLGSALRIVSQAAQGLDSAHDARAADGSPLDMVHRDISPSNILLSTAGLAKVIDFGVAKSAVAVHRTMQGIVRGKLPYFAPEQATGQPLDRRTDVYALGLLLYELLAGRRAVQGKNEGDLAEAVLQQRFEPLEKVRPDLPKVVHAIVRKALALDREQRFQTAGHLSELLERAIVAERLEVTPAALATLARAFLNAAPPPSEPPKEREPVPLTFNAPTETVPGMGAGQLARPASLEKPPPPTPADGAPLASVRTDPEPIPAVSRPAPDEKLALEAASAKTDPGLPAVSRPREPTRRDRPEPVPPGRLTTVEEDDGGESGPPEVRATRRYGTHEELPSVGRGAAEAQAPAGAPGAPSPELPDFLKVTLTDQQRPSQAVRVAAPVAPPLAPPAPAVAPKGTPSARPLDPVTLPMEAQPRPSQARWFWPVVLLASLAVMGSVAAVVFYAVSGGAGRDERRAVAQPPPRPTPAQPAGTAALDAGAAQPATAEAPRDAGPRPEAVALAAAEAADAGAPAGDATTPPSTVGTGTLEITARPAMGVSVDGVDKGSTPQVLSLPPGGHVVKLRNAGLDVTHEETVTVAADKHLTLAWTPKRGWLDLRAVPATANLRLTVDGKAMGTTPLEAVRLYEGQHVVKVASESGWSAQTQVRIPADSHVLVWARSEVGLSVEAKGAAPVP